jgi:O-antigen ligase
LGAATVYFTFVAIGPRAVSRLVKGTGLALVIAGLIAVSPIGDQIIEMIPTMGKPADMYRHRLSERGWELVLAHPFFGDRFPWPEMEDLRQGEGIIDIVNTYLGVGLNYGFVGLFCFLSFILLGMTRTYARAKELSHADPDFALFGSSLIACIVGTLIMIDSSSFILGCEKVFFVLAGLAAAYVRLTRLSPRRPAERGAGNVLQE